MRSRIISRVSARRCTRSFRKVRTIAASVPKCSITSKSTPGPRSIPRSSCITQRCPKLLTGRNSRIPCINASKITYKTNMLFSFSCIFLNVFQSKTSFFRSALPQGFPLNLKQYIIFSGRLQANAGKTEHLFQIPWEVFCCIIRKHRCCRSDSSVRLQTPVFCQKILNGPSAFYFFIGQIFLFILHEEVSHRSCSSDDLYSEAAR